MSSASDYNYIHSPIGYVLMAFVAAGLIGVLFIKLETSEGRRNLLLFFGFWVCMGLLQYFIRGL